MKIYGKIIIGTRILKELAYENKVSEVSFNDKLEDCLINICKRLEIPVPLWINKNTKEFVRFRKTNFEADQFIETVKFDRFEIRVDI